MKSLLLFTTLVSLVCSQISVFGALSFNKSYHTDAPKQLYDQVKIGMSYLETEDYSFFTSVHWNEVNTFANLKLGNNSDLRVAEMRSYVGVEQGLNYHINDQFNFKLSGSVSFLQNSSGYHYNEGNPTGLRLESADTVYRINYGIGYTFKAHLFEIEPHIIYSSALTKDIPLGGRIDQLSLGVNLRIKL